MLSIEDFKKSLGIEAQKLSDKQIKELNLLFDNLATTLFGQWLKRISKKVPESHNNVKIKT